MSGDLDQWDKKEIAREILTYLSDHPDANDTLEGIAEWWLLERRINHGVVLIEKTLNELVTNGIVEKIMSRNFEASYRIKKP